MSAGCHLEGSANQQDSSFYYNYSNFANDDSSIIYKLIKKETQITNRADMFDYIFFLHANTDRAVFPPLPRRDPANHWFHCVLTL